MEAKELRNMRAGAVIAWMLALGIWAVIIYFVQTTKNQSILIALPILFIVLAVSTVVCLPPILYATHKLRKREVVQDGPIESKI
jgi:membrane protein YdbS with pleckstrin-like domain